MRKSKVGKSGWALALALAIGAPSGPALVYAKSKPVASSQDSPSEGTAPSTGAMSKEDQDKLREHNKLRAEIKKVKYPASKQDVVAHIKGIKPDDKKWFSDTLPDKTYNSAEEVYSAIGWEATPAAK